MQVGNKSSVATSPWCRMLPINLFYWAHFLLLHSYFLWELICWILLCGSHTQTPEVSNEESEKSTNRNLSGGKDWILKVDKPSTTMETLYYISDCKVISFIGARQGNRYNGEKSQRWIQQIEAEWVLACTVILYEFTPFQTTLNSWTHLAEKGPHLSKRDILFLCKCST